MICSSNTSRPVTAPPVFPEYRSLPPPDVVEGRVLDASPLPYRLQFHHRVVDGGQYGHHRVVHEIRQVLGRLGPDPHGGREDGEDGVARGPSLGRVAAGR